MSFALHVDTPRWRAHLDAVAAETAGLVPVAKGNGYGLGLVRLAEEATRLGAAALAVGVAEEVAAVRPAYAGPVLVLTPWHPAYGDPPAADPQVVHTVSHTEAVDALPDGARVVVELATSMRRHGLAAGRWAARAGRLRRLTVEGLALHLPLASPGSYAEAQRLVADARAAGLPVPSVWVSHLTPAQTGMLADSLGLPVRLRTGTRLWLGDRGALRVRGTVLDVHRVQRGDRFGYRQRRAVAPGHLLVVSGGTAHGVGLEAPKAVRGLGARAKVAASGGLAVAGWARSPFTVAGAQRWFAEPPHMQVSMLLLPAGVTPPSVGEPVEAQVRMTTATFDRVVLG